MANMISSLFAMDSILIEAYLPKDSNHLLSYTWNGRRVSKKSSRAIIKILNEHVSSFKQIKQDVRIPIEGPMMQLAPSAVFSFKHNGANVNMDLFTFTEEIRVVQIVIELEKKYYFSS